MYQAGDGKGMILAVDRFIGRLTTQQDCLPKLALRVQHDREMPERIEGHEAVSQLLCQSNGFAQGDDSRATVPSQALRLAHHAKHVGMEKRRFVSQTLQRLLR